MYMIEGIETMAKTVGASEFKAKCLRLINEMDDDGEPITITKRGRAVAVLYPAPRVADQPSILGALRGSVLAYDDPFLPAADPSDWVANQ